MANQYLLLITKLLAITTLIISLGTAMEKNGRQEKAGRFIKHQISTRSFTGGVLDCSESPSRYTQPTTNYRHKPEKASFLDYFFAFETFEGKDTILR
jgi:hypothetical protein